MKVRVISGISGEPDYNTNFPSNPYKMGNVNRTAIGKVNLFNRGVLVAPRGAFLSLVNLNILGLATALKRKHDTNRGELQNKWEQLGGTYDKLQKAFNIGANRRPILRKLGSRIGLGAEPVTTTSAAVGWVTTALLILKEIVPIIRQFIPPPAEFDESVTVEDVDNEQKKASTNLIITAGLVGAALFMITKRK
jgi:hypothetical protein